MTDDVADRAMEQPMVFHIATGARGRYLVLATRSRLIGESDSAERRSWSE